MGSALRQTVKVGADHSIVVRNLEWNPGEELEVLVQPKSSSTTPYSFIDVASDLALDTPEDYSTSYEQVLKGDCA